MDVLVLVTDDAAFWLQTRSFVQFGPFNVLLGDLWLEFAYLFCNWALTNSAVGNFEFRFRTVFQNIALSFNMGNDLNDMSNNPIVQALRDQFRADLVVA
ncbi:hypothetical protein RZS08_44940, partial [Arthrospira platensis SPKY1]|nr:hypothetical protein [Arthrospira platensis SPKY1]